MLGLPSVAPVSGTGMMLVERTTWLPDKSGAVQQGCRRLRNDPLDDLGCSRGIVHQIDTLPGPDDTCGEIIVRRRQIELLLLRLLRGQCVLPAIPAGRK